MHRPYSSPETHRLQVESFPVTNDVAVICLCGEADLHTAPILRDALDHAVETGAGTIVVDLTGVTFVDSMMLGVLLGASRTMRPRGSELRIVVNDPHLRRIFELTLLDRVLELHSSLEGAVSPERRSGG